MSNATRSVNSKIATGAFWTIGMRLGIRALGVVSVIILARILVPEDFGIVAKASMIASFLELITEFGLEAALIQNQSARSEHYDTVWTIHVIRGVVIALSLVVLAVPAAEFLNEPVLGTVLLFYALSAFINGLENIGVVNFRKDLEFDRDFRFNIYKKLAGFIVTIGIAIVWETYWAFVAGVITVSSTSVLASYGMSHYRPRLNLSEWRSLFHFSKWIFIGGIVGSVSIKLDTFILSRLSTTAVVGQYTLAHEISGAATTEVAMPIARATMPGLAQLSKEPERFRSTYTLSVLLVMLIVIPAAVGLSALSEPVTFVLLGDKWAGAAPLIAILAIFGIMRAVFSMSASAFLASGEVKMHANLSIVNLFLRILSMGAGYRAGGVVGMAWGVLVASVIQNIISLYIQKKLNFVDINEFKGGIWRPILAATIMYMFLMVGWKHMSWVNELTTGPALALQVIGGMLVYFVTLGGLWILFGGKGGPEKVVVGFFAGRSSK